MTQEKEQAIQFLSQLAQDFVNTLPISARNITAQIAQNAIDILKKEEVKKPE